MSLRAIQGGKAEGAARIPPTDLDGEALILGTLLWGDCSRSLPLFRSMLEARHFFSEGHSRIYRAALEVADAHGVEGVDLATVQARLSETGNLGAAGGRESLEELRRNVTSTNSKRHRQWAISVHDAWRRRQACAAAQRIEAEAYLGVESTQDYLDAATKGFLALANLGLGREEESPAAALARLYRQIEARAAAHGRSEAIAGMGAPTGLRGFDRFTRGLRPQKKITIAARPGVGKTAFAAQAALHAAGQGVGVLYFSFEPSMSRDDHLLRLIAAGARVDANRVIDGLLDPREHARIFEAVNAISKVPLVFVDARGWHVDRAIGDATRRRDTFKASHGAELGVCVFDYVGAILPIESLLGRRKFEQVAYSTTRLAELAPALDVAVLELAQDKRPDAKAGNAKPKSEDVADTGEIEKTTDALCFLRPVSPRNGAGEQFVRGTFTKNRGGDLGDFDLTFFAKHVRFVDGAQVRMSLDVIDPRTGLRMGAPRPLNPDDDEDA